MTTDRESLRTWYRQAMVRRADELRGLRKGLAAVESAACDEARAIGQALRGSGATFGFPRLTELASIVEDAPDQGLLRRVEGLVSQLVSLAAASDEAEDTGAFPAEWLVRAAGIRSSVPTTFHDLATAWIDVARSASIDSGELARRVASYFDLPLAELESPRVSALRLVPEVLVRQGLVLPVAEDSETITVATADPVSLSSELQLTRLTSRTPRFQVATPEAIRQAIAAFLDSAAPSPVVQRRAVVETEAGTGRVLIVDDEASSRLLARTLLEKNGYDVVEAGDGLDALESLRAQQPVALVVADLNMPRMDGLELIWEMRAAEDWTHIPVVVVTGETDEVLETKLIEEGADDYIRKPLDPRLFVARVGATIRRAED